MPWLQAVLKLSGVCGPGLDPEVLFHQAMAHMDLWLLQHQLQLITALTATPEAINCCMQMLESAAKKAAALALEGHDISGYEAACAAARVQIEAAAGGRALQVAEKYQLPPAEELLGGSEQLGTWRLPKGIIPPAYKVHAEGEGLAAARRRAEKNLGSLRVMEEGRPLGEALQLLQQLLKQQGLKASAGAVAGGDVAVLLALRAVEQQLFSRAVAGFTQSGTRLNGEQEVRLLEDVVDAYRKVSRDFINSKSAEAFLKVDQRSRELLVVWVAYCMKFEAARNMHPLAAQCGVALNYRDLRHLVLSDKAAVDAALGVAEYLRQHLKAGRDLFSLKDEGLATFRFAEEFARQDWRMMDIWQQEKQDADARVQKHWAEVQRKQRLAAELRRKLTRLRAKYSSLSAEASSLYCYYERHQSHAYHCAKGKADSKQSEITCAERELRAAEAAPAPVIQPLPQAEARALQWLFFLYMPPVLRCLSRSSFLAQQLLLPLPDYPDEVQGSTFVEAFNTSMVDHYCTYQQCSYHTPSRSRSGEEGQVLFRSYGVAPQPRDIGRSTCILAYILFLLMLVTTGR